MCYFQSLFQSTTVTNLSVVQTKLYNSLNVVGKLFKRKLIDRYQIDFPDTIKVREDNWFMMKFIVSLLKLRF